MGRIYGYKNQLWREIHHFEYTGEPKAFTLTPGRYLLMCHGAHGGVSSTDTINYGGVAYGILNLEETNTMYAVVGGNGESNNGYIGGAGGYNGGGDGGNSYSDRYIGGAGGGGASDIRLTIDPELTEILTIPPEYTELTFIQTDTDHSGWIDTEYVPNSTTKFEVNCEPSSTYTENWSCMFGSDETWSFHSKSSSYTNRYCYYINGNSHHMTNCVYNEPILVKIDNNKLECYHNDELIGTSTPSVKIGNLSFLYPISIFCNRNGTNSTRERSHMKLFHFKIYEGDELIRYFVPCKDADEHYGLFELIQQKFYVSPNEDREFIPGDVVPEQNRTNYKVYFNRPIYTRIIVAGGGGGGTRLGSNNSYYDYSGFGGGAVGGFVSCSTSLSTNEQYADQMNGYKFAEGESVARSATNTSGGAEGSGGGGGGWYGGYAIQTSGNYTSGNGGGGSGYVLTTESYKPDGYEVPEQFYLTDTYMGGGHATEPFIAVCEPVDKVLAGDEVIFYPTGESVSVPFPPGQYRLKCWGGDGGCRRTLSQTARGGYAEGILNMHGSNVFHVRVGTAGMFDGCLSNEYVHQIRPDINYNGGGLPTVYGTVTPNGHSGGGASDIRIGVDSLYARVIVAGGAGGMGSGIGGAGGGETGVSGSGSYGTTPGPGTQTDSPISPVYAVINGGFGYGGNAPDNNGSGVGGAGGGGWYGGSGTYPSDSSDRHRGGCGGSGYVLTADSYKPTDYLLDEEFHLTDTRLVQGGNNLPIGHTQIVIEVVDAFDLKMLCRDAEGIKTYDKKTGSWTLTPSQILSVTLFENYGVLEIPSDNGLLDEFEILTWDPEDLTNTVDLNVVPNTQVVTCNSPSKLNVKKAFFDLTYDRDAFNVDMKVEKKSNGLESSILTTVTIDKLTDSDSRPKIFYASYLSK